MEYEFVKCKHGAGDCTATSCEHGADDCSTVTSCGHGDGDCSTVMSCLQDAMLFCDSCDKGYHMECHIPPIMEKPTG